MSIPTSTDSLPAKPVHKFYIGIDPGRHTGVAVWDPKKKKLLNLYTMEFWDVIEFLQVFRKGMHSACVPGEVLFPSDLDFEIQMEIVIEDPNLNKAMYRDRLIGKEVVTALTMAQAVGRNKEQAFLLITYLEKNKIKFRTVQPKNKHQGGGKWEADYFTRMTKWEGKSNEHTRDAARLVFGL